MWAILGLSLKLIPFPMGSPLLDAEGWGHSATRYTENDFIVLDIFHRHGVRPDPDSVADLDVAEDLGAGTHIQVVAGLGGSFLHFHVGGEGGALIEGRPKANFAIWPDKDSLGVSDTKPRSDVGFVRELGTGEAVVEHLQEVGRNFVATKVEPTGDAIHHGGVETEILEAVDKSFGIQALGFPALGVFIVVDVDGPTGPLDIAEERIPEPGLVLGPGWLRLLAGDLVLGVGGCFVVHHTTLSSEGDRLLVSMIFIRCCEHTQG